MTIVNFRAGIVLLAGLTVLQPSVASTPVSQTPIKNLAYGGYSGRGYWVCYRPVRAYATNWRGNWRGYYNRRYIGTGRMCFVSQYPCRYYNRAYRYGWFNNYYQARNAAMWCTRR